MGLYAAALRGINVGGKHRLTMAAVKDAFAAAGASDVATYVQSGNVVFRHAARAQGPLAARLSAALGARAGFEVPVVLRSRDEWAALLAACPYDGEPKTVHAMLLPSAPAPDALEAVDAAAFAPSAFALRGRDLFLFLPEGMGRAKLAALLARHPATRDGTARNLATLRAVEAMLVERRSP